VGAGRLYEESPIQAGDSVTLGGRELLVREVLPVSQHGDGLHAVVDNYLALSLAVVICLWGSARIAWRVEALHAVKPSTTQKTAGDTTNRLAPIGVIRVAHLRGMQASPGPACQGWRPAPGTCAARSAAVRPTTRLEDGGRCSPWNRRRTGRSTWSRTARSALSASSESSALGQ
jgi:hypothetical protein